MPSGALGRTNQPQGITPTAASQKARQQAPLGPQSGSLGGKGPQASFKVLRRQQIAEVMQGTAACEREQYRICLGMITVLQAVVNFGNRPRPVCGASDYTFYSVSVKPHTFLTIESEGHKVICPICANCEQLSDSQIMQKAREVIRKRTGVSVQ